MLAPAPIETLEDYLDRGRQRFSPASRQTVARPKKGSAWLMGQLA